MKMDIYLGPNDAELSYVDTFTVETLPRIGDTLQFHDAEDPKHPYKVWDVVHSFTGASKPPAISVFVKY